MSLRATCLLSGKKCGQGPGSSQHFTAAEGGGQGRPNFLPLGPPRKLRPEKGLGLSSHPGPRSWERPLVQIGEASATTSVQSPWYSWAPGYGQGLSTRQARASTGILVFFICID